MLAKVNRVTTLNDFQRATRTGRKAGSKSFVVHITKNELEVTRFGYVVSKNVGNSVIRHTLSRKLREISREQLTTLPTGYDIVVRALAGSENLTSAEIRKQIAPTITRILKKG
jgi:ribonuclease P protein component